VLVLLVPGAVQAGVEQQPAAAELPMQAGRHAAGAAAGKVCAVVAEAEGVEQLMHHQQRHRQLACVAGISCAQIPTPLQEQQQHSQHSQTAAQDPTSAAEPLLLLLAAAGTPALAAPAEEAGKQRQQQR
jgi:hypothetical protein